MNVPTLLDDARTLGFEIDGLAISAKGQPLGSLRGATVTVQRSKRKPTFWAQLSTPLNRRSQMQGKDVLIVTITCLNATLYRQVPIKHEIVARRFANGMNMLAAMQKIRP